MPGSVFFKADGPIGDTDINALPVKEIGPAVGYYTQCLSFTLVSKDGTTARLRRDDVQIGLAVNAHDPEQASCRFSVGDVDALWREYEARGIGPGVIDERCPRWEIALPRARPWRARARDGSIYRRWYVADPRSDVKSGFGTPLFQPRPARHGMSTPPPAEKTAFGVFDRRRGSPGGGITRESDGG